MRLTSLVGSAPISIHALREEGDATSAMPRMCV